MLFASDLDVASVFAPFVHTDPGRDEVTVDHTGGTHKDHFFSLKVAFDMALDANHPGQDIAPDPPVAAYRDDVPGKRHLAFEPAVDRQVLGAAHLPFEEEGFTDEGMFYSFTGRSGQDGSRRTGVWGRDQEFPEIFSPHGGIERAANTAYGSRSP